MPVEPPRSAAFPLQSALRILLDLLLLCFALNLVLQPLVEPDFGWHLRAGLDWLSHGLRLPDTDPVWRGNLRGQARGPGPVGAAGSDKNAARSAETADLDKASGTLLWGE